MLCNHVSAEPQRPKTKAALPFLSHIDAEISQKKMKPTAPKMGDFLVDLEVPLFKNHQLDDNW